MNITTFMMNCFFIISVFGCCGDTYYIIFCFSIVIAFLDLLNDTFLPNVGGDCIVVLMFAVLSAWSCRLNLSQVL